MSFVLLSKKCEDLPDDFNLYISHKKTPNFLENYVWMWSGWNNLSFPLQNQNFDVT